MGRLGIRIVNGLLFALCSFQVAGVFNKVSAELLMPAAASFAFVPPRATDVGGDWSDLEPILERNLFGAQIVPIALPEPEPEEKLDETKLPLQLLGTLLSDNPKTSTAAIADKGAADHELLREGDQLARHQHVRVARIERGRVILQNRDRREELLLNEDQPLAAASFSPRALRPDRRSSRRPSASRSKRSTPRPPAIAEQLNELRIGGSEVRNAGDLLSQAKITPKWLEGEMQGMELREIEPGSLYDKVGLEDGDVIQSFNGIRLDSTAAGAEVLKQFAEADQFEIELTDGTVKTVSADELPDLLGE